ncbi:MAG TPA: DUF4404 family protein [Anaerolineales bacterium]|nr:DUF4404 family protein [Anaerolineales bacterium]
MPVQNYKYEKRQRDLEKKKKHDRKLSEKQGRKAARPTGAPATVPEVRKHLDNLHAEMEQAQNVDEKGRELLRGTSEDIHALLERTGDSVLAPQPSTLQRLEEAIDHLEATHPKVTAVLTELLNVLSNTGL